MTAESFTEREIVILQGLEEEGPMSPKEISDNLSIPLRTVTRNLRKLRKKNLCKKIPNLHDMRRPLYLCQGEQS
ncbi:MAG: MarR family transcriptional regulator [Candidatus Thorarchaeota archaeon]|nr:MarR family transcriptional regulator [Candidatus Thorarchaeota archaeon]